jgi:hypothetical protein
MEMTNEQNAKRLEEMARVQVQRAESYRRESEAHSKAGSDATSAIHSDIADLAESDAALFRESAALWRERDGVPADEWIVECRMRHKDHDLLVSKRPTQGVWYWQAWTQDDLLAQTGHAPTLDAAKAAAIAWVDGQEGR